MFTGPQNNTKVGFFLFIKVYIFDPSYNIKWYLHFMRKRKMWKVANNKKQGKQSWYFNFCNQCYHATVVKCIYASRQSHNSLQKYTRGAFRESWPSYIKRGIPLKGRYKQNEKHNGKACILYDIQSGERCQLMQLNRNVNDYGIMFLIWMIRTSASETFDNI